MPCENNIFRIASAVSVYNIYTTSSFNIPLHVFVPKCLILSDKEFAENFDVICNADFDIASWTGGHCTETNEI